MAPPRPAAGSVGAESRNRGAGAEVLAIACGSSHSAVLLSGSVVATFGQGEDGQLGHGDAEEQHLPAVLPPLLTAGIKLITCGAEHSGAASSSQLFTWGWGDFGRLGHGDSRDVFLPTPVSVLEGKPIELAECGDSHSLVTTAADGALYAFGRNQTGQIGNGGTADAFLPQRVPALDGQRVVSIACGAEHSACATSDGKVWTWGWNCYGNLGLGDRTDRLTPEVVRGDLEGQSVAQVACGWRHTIAVTADGAIFTFGWGRYGQLGHGDNEDHLLPRRMGGVFAGDGKCAGARGGWRHTMAIAADGGVLYAWGWNKFGQLGLGDGEDRNAPCKVGLPEPAAQVACGWRHTLAVGASGAVYSWGRGVNGQLGHGDTAELQAPKRIAAIDALCGGGAAAAAARQGGAGAAAGESAAAAGAAYVPPSQRYARVPDQAPQLQVPDVGEGAAVPEAQAPPKRARRGARE